MKKCMTFVAVNALATVVSLSHVVRERACVGVCGFLCVCVGVCVGVMAG